MHFKRCDDKHNKLDHPVSLHQMRFILMDMNCDCLTKCISKCPQEDHERWNEMKNFITYLMKIDWTEKKCFK